MKPRYREAAWLLFLFLLAWAPRALALDAYVSPDERKWLARSANFAYALSRGDFAQTFQREHPGVTVMWAGTLGLLGEYPTYPQEAPGYFTWEQENLEAWLKTNTDHAPLDLLAAGRSWIAFGVALTLWLCIFPLHRLIGRNAAHLAFIFMALDPFSVALSRQLHPDGFVASFIFLSLLHFLAWLYAGLHWRDLAISGVVMGLAWLTKTPAALLAPIGGVLVAGQMQRLWRRQQVLPEDPYVDRDEAVEQAKPHPSLLTPRPLQLLIAYVIWGAIAVATFFLLWPAMWGDPLGALMRMATEMEAYVEGHVNPNFFWGQPTGDPGIFFYPVAIFFRITPGVLIGLIAAAIFYFRQDWTFADLRTRRTVRALTFFVVVFVVAMTMPAKKFDRYVLPIFLALDVLAALGWLSLSLLPWRPDAPAWLQRLRAISPTAALLTLAFVLHGVFTLLTYPYYLTYYNPLAGGSRTAPAVLFVGWGEGLDAAARWLNAQPGSENFRVAAWYADGPFSYFSDSQVVPMGYSSPLSWLDTDYAVTYVNQWQRQLPSPAAVTWFAAQTPAFEVHKDGLTLARVYDLRNTLLPPFIDLNTAPAADFGGAIRLIGVELPQGQMAAGAEQLVTFYLQALAPMSTNYNALVRLVAPDGAELWRADGWPWGAPTSAWPVREVRPDGYTLTIPSDAAPGLYQLVLSFYDPTTLAPLPATPVRGGDPLPAGEQKVALIQIGAPADAGVTPLASPYTLGDVAYLAGAMLPTTAPPGAPVTLQLQWETLATPAADYTLFVHLVDGAGALAAQQDQPPLGGFAPTHTWQPGQRIVDMVTLTLPPDLAPGRYTVRVGLYTGDVRLPVSQSGAVVGDFAVVGEIIVP